MNDPAPDFHELMARARRGDPEALGQLLEACRAYLRRLADRQLQGRVAVRVDASDVVQQTFLEAHQSFGQFLGQAEPEWLAWLETILGHKVARTIRDHAETKKRSVGREQALADPAGDDSRPHPDPSAGYTSPSHKAMRREDVERLARALDELPPDQREAVRLRHLEGWPLADIARHLGRTPAATAGLIKRGMQALRQHLRPPE